MAIQNRRGSYTHFDPTKMVAGEFAVVQQNDPNATDGKSVYIAFSPNDVKRLATHEELENYNQEAQLAAEAAEEAQEAAEAALADVQTLKTATETAAGNAAQSAQDAADTLASVETSVQAMKEQALEDFAEEAEAKHDELMEDIIATGQAIADTKTQAETIASQALSTATNAENHMASLDSQMADIKTQLNNVSIDPDDLGLYQDADTYYVYPTYKGVVSENGIPLSAGGGGGGGGGDITSAVLTVENTTGWLSKTVAYGSACNVSFLWSSVEDEMPTGDGNIRITVNDAVMTTYQIQQGNVSVNLLPYLTKGGAYKIKIRISDTYDQGKTITFNITVVELTLTSTFDASAVYSSIINFPYTPTGSSVEKTVHFIIDGTQVGTQVVTVSGRQQTYTLPAQTHGSHSLRVYFEAIINNETVRSNELYFEFMFVEDANFNTIITSNFHETTQQQYASIAIPFIVYNPRSLTADVTISANGTVVANLTGVDRTEHSYTYRANDAGSLVITIASGNTTKTINITVTESDVDVEAETDDLALYLTSQGRSNQNPNRNEWISDTDAGTVSTTMSNFNFVSDGWIPDEDGIVALRVTGDARVTIPYKPFASDFRTTGKTFEFEFATRNVLNYDAVIMSCMSGNRGFSITAQKATLKSEQSEISTQYKEDEHVRIAFVVEKRNETRFLYIYINGIASGVVQYPSDDDFSQTSPVNITIGSNDCTIDIYNIRIYDNNLNRFQIVDNWIADTQIGTVMLERFTRNNVFDAYGNIVISQLPSDLPYMIVSCAELPQSKGDKKTCSGSFTNPLYPSKSFTFENCQNDVQGTSSQYYARKNYKMKFNSGFNMTASGSNVSKYAMNTDAIPVKTFCMKADYASSEGANNVELVRLYEDACPYKTPAQVANPKVRQGIDGFPMIMFWNNTSTNETSFIGKYNFNNDKSTEEVFGFDDPDESWETLNNASDRVLYKSGDFSGDGWKSDFEARYPDTDPAYEDTAQLAEFATWAASTDTTAATGNALDESVTYDGVTYTNDTAAYRLAKFKAEAGNYMEMDSALFYYLFTELFLMVDSRAKNAFPSFIGSEVTNA